MNILISINHQIYIEFKTINIEKKSTKPNHGTRKKSEIQPKFNILSNQYME